MCKKKNPYTSANGNDTYEIKQFLLGCCYSLHQATSHRPIIDYFPAAVYAQALNSLWRAAAQCLDNLKVAIGFCFGTKIYLEQIRTIFISAALKINKQYRA